MRDWPENGQPLSPAEEEAVSEFSSRMSARPQGVSLTLEELEAREGQAWAVGFAQGRDRSRDLDVETVEAPGVDEAPQSAVVRTLVLEGIAVGLAWTIGSLLGEFIRREVES